MLACQALLDKLVNDATRIFNQFQQTRKERQDGRYPSTFRAQPAISDVRSHSRPKPQADPFEHVHPTLRSQCRELNELQDPPVDSPATGIQLDSADVRNGSFTAPTLSTDSPSKALENRSLSLDYGAFTLGPDDQSLMTWF